MSGSIEAIVIGAGVVGLAIARALAERGREVIVVERNPRIGEGISARNSEVIHAGIYYPQDSLKATLCVRGRDLLYDYCARKGIAHARCGKLIVATHEGQLDALDALRAKALGNGVNDIELLTAARVHTRAPALRAVAGLRSPSTGIIDTHGLMLALQGDLEAAGGHVAVLTSFVGAVADTQGIRVTIESQGEQSTHDVEILVNAASLDASDVAAAIHGLPADHIPVTRFAKGNYFMLHGKSPFAELIYPLPEPGGLGVHLTIELAGRARFGPDVEWTDTIDYDVDPKRAPAFYSAIRRYWPDLPANSLVPAYAGIRPKIVGPGEPAGDFVVSGPSAHGIDGLVNLFGIESPGLTSALALGELVVARL